MTGDATMPTERGAAIAGSASPVSSPVWCPVANLRSERSYGQQGVEIRRGTQHFAPGAKLRIRRIMQWMREYPTVEVVGHHRGSHRYVRMVVRASWLENWRVDLEYSPHVIRELWPKWDGTAESRATAEEYVRLLSQAVARQESAEAQVTDDGGSGVER